PPPGVPAAQPPALDPYGNPIDLNRPVDPNQPALPYDPMLTQQQSPSATPDVDGYDADYEIQYGDPSLQQGDWYGDSATASGYYGDLDPDQGYDDGYDPQAYSGFESDLAPYGSWVDSGSYGRVWIPSATLVGYDFSPYSTGGHWVLTEFGWTWVSDYSWGW